MEDSYDDDSSASNGFCLISANCNGLQIRTILTLMFQYKQELDEILVGSSSPADLLLFISNVHDRHIIHLCLLVNHSHHFLPPWLLIDIATSMSQRRYLSY